jgi:nucleobase:cation symporter-1, NCS1 family
MTGSERGVPGENASGRLVESDIASPERSGNRAFEVEQHGIDHIPDSDRRGRPFDLFWIWFGSNLVFTYVIDGALIVGFGLGFWAALAVALVGNAFWILVGLCSIPGARAGTATLVVSRSSFGILGNLPGAFLSWLTAVGWEAVNIVIGALSLYEIFQEFGAGGGASWKALALAMIIVMTFGVAVLGHAAITLLNKIFSYLLGIGTLVLGLLVLPKANLHAHPALGAPTHVGAWLLALVVMAAAPFSFVNIASDYSRYLPRRTSGARITLWTTLGGAIPGVLITVFGVAAATATNMADPVAGLKAILPNWFFVTYLAVIVFGTITNNFLNTYSSGMSLLALGLKIRRWQAVMTDAVIGTALSAYALFVSNFTNSFTSFLSLMLIWIAPWCGIYLADMALRRGNYDVAALFQHGGRYWFRRGFNPVGLAWFAVGIVLAALFASNTIYSGPLTGLIGGGDISIFVGFVVPLAGYYLNVRGRAARADGALVASAAADASESASPVIQSRAAVANQEETA